MSKYIACHGGVGVRVERVVQERERERKEGGEAERGEKGRFLSKIMLFTEKNNLTDKGMMKLFINQRNTQDSAIIYFIL